MRLSAPIHKLKRRAKLLAREQALPLHAALDRIAQTEGARSWSHLIAVAAPCQPPCQEAAPQNRSEAPQVAKESAGPAARQRKAGQNVPPLPNQTGPDPVGPNPAGSQPGHPNPDPRAPNYRTLADRILAGLCPGDMLLLAARPGQGKTLAGIGMAARAAGPGYFFTLDFNAQDVTRRLHRLGLEDAGGAELVIDTSDAICAAHILRRVTETAPHRQQTFSRSANRGPSSGQADGARIAPPVIVIDYLQLLDQRRTNPSLAEQVRALRSHAKVSRSIVVMISQVDRAFDLCGRRMPGLADIRLPNPLDLSLFDRACFLHDGAIHLAAAA